MIGTFRFPKDEIFEKGMPVGELLDSLKNYSDDFHPRHLASHLFDDIDISPNCSPLSDSSDASASNSEDSHDSGNIYFSSAFNHWLPPTKRDYDLDDYDLGDLFCPSPLSKSLCVNPEEIYRTNFSQSDRAQVFGLEATNSLNRGLSDIYNSVLNVSERVNTDRSNSVHQEIDTSSPELSADGADISDINESVFSPEIFSQLGEQISNIEEKKREQQLIDINIDHNYCLKPISDPEENKLQPCENSSESSLPAVDDIDDTPDDKDDDQKDATWYPTASAKKRRGRPPSNTQNKRQKCGSGSKPCEKIQKAKRPAIEKKSKNYKTPEVRRGHNDKERKRRAELTNNLAEVEKRIPKHICKLTGLVLQTKKIMNQEDSENELSHKVLRKVINVMNGTETLERPKKRPPQRNSKMNVLLSSVYYLKHDLDVSIQVKKDTLEELLKEKRKLRKVKP